MVSFFRTSINVLLLAGLCSASISCQDKTRPRKMIRLWHSFNAQETRTLNRLLEKYARLHRSVKVQSTVIAFPAARSTFISAARNNSQTPDVFRAEITWLPELIRHRLIRPLNELFPAKEQRKFLDRALQYSRYKNKIWSVPQGIDCLALLVNRHQLAQAGVQPPRTLVEFAKAATRLTQDNAGKHYGQKGFTSQRLRRYGFHVRGDTYWFLPFLWSDGGRLLDKRTGEVMIDRMSSVSALTFYVKLHDLYHHQGQSIDFSTDYEKALNDFKKGRVAMIINGPWATASILKGAEFMDPRNLGILPIPRGIAGAYTPTGGHHFIIPRLARHPREAMNLIRFLTSKEAQTAFAKHNNLLPTRKAAYSQPAVRYNQVIQGFRKALRAGRPRTVIPQTARFYYDLSAVIRAVLRKEKTPARALTSIALAWRARLAKARAAALSAKNRGKP